ncbi:MAG: FHA domain-containing protein, partial [Planctomycetota bacterium]
MIRIEVVHGAKQFDYDYDGDEPLLAGRVGSVDLPIPHSDVSRRHFEIVPDGDGGFLVRDLGSKNGISLEGQPITESALKPGQALQIGAEVTVQFGRVAAKVAATPAPKPVS